MDVLLTRELLRSTGDLATYVDISNADIRTFMQANVDKFGGPAQLTYRFDSNISAADMARAVSVATKDTALLRATVRRSSATPLPPPFFQCSYFDPSGVESRVNCTGDSAASFSLCTRNGTIGCRLIYHDVDASRRPLPGTYRKLCLEAWQRENNPVSFLSLYDIVRPARNRATYTVDRPASESVALQYVLRTLDSTWDARLPAARRTAISSCQPGVDTVVTNVTAGSGKQWWWQIKCGDRDGQRAVTELWFVVTSSGSDNVAQQHPNWNALVPGLLGLRHLEIISAIVYDGYVSLDISLLTKLRVLLIFNFCVRGNLPPSLLEAMPQLDTLWITPFFNAEGFVDPTGGGPCGLSGHIPSRWQTVSAMKDMNLGAMAE
jgi:hypothetical protein